MWHRGMEHQIWWIIKQAVGLAIPNCSLGNTWDELCNIVERLKTCAKMKSGEMYKATNKHGED